MVLNVFIFISFMMLSAISSGHFGDLTEQCPETMMCNEKHINILQMLSENKLDCRNFARYLACLDGKLHRCNVTSHSHHDNMDVVANDNSTDSPDTNSTDTHHVTYEHDPLAELKETRSRLCGDNDGIIAIPSNYSKLFGEHYAHSKEKYASFENYEYIHKNLSKQTGCAEVANCTLILEPHAKFTSVYFPCPALLEFEECFKYNKNGCSSAELSSLSSSVESLNNECQVGSAGDLKLCTLLLVASLILALW